MTTTPAPLTPADPATCLHDDPAPAVTHNGNPAICARCGTVFVPVTFPAITQVPEPVYVDRPAPLRSIRCPDGIDTTHDPHPWDVELGPWGDVQTVVCDGQPRPDEGTEPDAD